ncbi:MAG: MerR family transcriptional regulator [Bacteroides sp.]|jgi:DNA-binding transcriptional MerR regulator|nr:MerR family transcriptional regulator [Bacteroides sp.]
MQKPDHKPERMYYSIGEVARMFKVNTSLIRFWEKEFDIIQPYRNKKGNRYFTPKDVDHFHLIYHLVKERGYTLQGAREKLKDNPRDVQRDFEIVKSLDKIRDFLLELKKEIKQDNH